MRKLTSDEVAGMVALYNAGGISQDSLAVQFGVSQKTVSLAVRGELWKEFPACKVCGVQIKEFGRTGSFSRYCSDACYTEGRRRRKRARYAVRNPKPVGRVCPHCGDPVPASRRADAMFCSSACEQRAHNATRKAKWKTGAPAEYVSRAYIVTRDGSRCHLCGKRCRDGEDLHLDHLVPLSRGGDHSAANIRVACAACNLSKRADARNDQLLLVG